jgi:riboflavin synthase
MFTGIIEALGQIKAVSNQGANRRFRITSPISKELKIDQSVSHNGVCLTVVDVQGDEHEVVAIRETLSKSNLEGLVIGDVINLERCMAANGRFDGHIVQGHVDQTATVMNISDQNGSWLFDFEYEPSTGNITVEKGSICINGVSLTCFNSHHSGFSVAIIPYTFEHTDFGQLEVGDKVNLEFDIIGKYVARLLKTS